MNPLKIWHSNENHLFLNPKLDSVDSDLAKTAYDKIIQEQSLESHIFILSSGSGGKKKLYALSKQAFLDSAKAVNQHCHIEEDDIWLNTLPLHHVGGLSIYARAFLKKNQVVTMNSWCPKEFQQKISEAQFSSLVPTQVYDIVNKKLLCPKGVKTIFVGGSHLKDSLFHQASELGWPILKTFGATEFCSQVATATKEQPDQLKILPHIEAKTDESLCLYIKTKSLFTLAYEINESKYIFPKNVDGFFKTEDHAQITGEFLKPLGRKSDYYKILGEAVSLAALEESLASYMEGDFLLVAKPEERREHEILLITTSVNSEIANQIKTWNQSRPAFERISKWAYSDRLERNEMGKLLRSKISSDSFLKTLSWNSV